MIGKFTWVISVDGELDGFLGTDRVPEVGEEIYISGNDPDHNDVGIIKFVTVTSEHVFDVEVERS